ncbi:MAG: NAD kinase [Rhodospirillaceae bacterium]|nr:NAD kinase [Rhodospirillaceae bacterium]
MTHKKITFVSTDTKKAQNACKKLTELYGNVSPKDADIIVALGGDGYMLEALHQYLPLNKPVFGMNRGTIGFLMNEYQEPNLLIRLEQAETVEVHPLFMEAIDNKGQKYSALAINEVSLLRGSRQAAKLKIFINARCRMDELICDGALVCTPAGSTAYNLSVHGPVLPLGSNSLAITPISAFRPRRWRGAVVPDSASIKFEIIDSKKRPVSVVADRLEIRDVLTVTIKEDRSQSIRMLFDPEHHLEERILAEQFLP